MSETARYSSHDSLNSLGFLSGTLLTVDAIDLPHDRFGPLHGSGNHLVGSRTSLWPAEQVISHVEIAGHDYPSNDTDDPLASFVLFRM